MQSKSTPKLLLGETKMIKSRDLKFSHHSSAVHACPICPQSTGLSVYLQSVINQSQDVLDCLLLGDVGHQVQKGFRTLHTNKVNKYKVSHSTKTQHVIN